MDRLRQLNVKRVGVWCFLMEISISTLCTRNLNKFIHALFSFNPAQKISIQRLSSSMSTTSFLSRHMRPYTHTLPFLNQRNQIYLFVADASLTGLGVSLYRLTEGLLYQSSFEYFDVISGSNSTNLLLSLRFQLNNFSYHLHVSVY